MDHSRLIFLKNFNDYKINNFVNLGKKIVTNTKKFDQKFLVQTNTFILLNYKIKSKSKFFKINSKFNFVNNLCKNLLIISEKHNIHIYNF